MRVCVLVQVPHGPLEQRNAANTKVQDLLKDNAGKNFAERKLLYRMQYRPKDGMFRKMPADLMLGNFIPEEESTDGQLDDAQRFTYMGTDYGVGCFVYMIPEYATPPCLVQRQYQLSVLLRSFCDAPYVELEARRFDFYDLLPVHLTKNVSKHVTCIPSTPRVV